MSVNGNEVGVHLVAFEMKEKVVYEALLVPVYLMLDLVSCCIAVLTYAELVNTTTIDSELHLNKFGAITSAKLAPVILVTV